MEKSNSEERIALTEKKLGIVIPQVYRDLLIENAQRDFDDGILYDIEQIEERYLSLEFDKYAPDLIPIGNDNGDYELVMKSGRRVRRFGFIEHGSIGSLKPSHLQDLTQWYANGHSFEHGDSGEEIDGSRIVKVVLTKCPVNKAAAIMKIRKAFHIDTPVSDLLRSAEKPPVVIVDSLTAVVARKIIAENSLEEWLDFKV